MGRSGVRVKSGETTIQQGTVLGLDPATGRDGKIPREALPYFEKRVAKTSSGDASVSYSESSLKNGISTKKESETQIDSGVTVSTQKE